MHLIKFIHSQDLTSVVTISWAEVSELTPLLVWIQGGGFFREKLWSWERWKTTSSAYFQGMASVSSVPEMGISRLVWKITMTIFQKLHFTNIKQIHLPEFMGNRARQPKSCPRWGLNSPEGWIRLSYWLCLWNLKEGRVSSEAPGGIYVFEWHLCFM